MRFTKAFCLIVLCAVQQPLFAAAAAPPLQEVYDLVRTNLAGVTETQLNEAAVAGLINELQPKVALVHDKENAATSKTNAPIISKATVFDNSYAYIRVGQFTDGTEKRFIESYRKLASTNRLKGLVVDVRYSAGQDYDQAAAMADWFFSKDDALIDWGEGLKKSTSKTNALELPLTVLVNHKTSGAAEAFAAILRQAQIGVVIGTNTAGDAAISKEFALSNGERLRVATAPIKLANGKEFPMAGLKPDIFVEVNPEDELAWLEDAYKVVGKSTARTPGLTNGALPPDIAGAFSTNRAGRRRLNEAELVRMLREGFNPENETALGAKEFSDRAKGLVSDPVLGRALDLLKGLTVVQHFKSS